MNWSFKEILSFCRDNGVAPTLKDSLHGLERECLRVRQAGELSQKPHPTSLGHPLTHPWISLDFSEAQIELITPPCKTEENALQFLHNLHHFIIHRIGDELLWPSSAPCILPEGVKIPLGQFGDSNLGKKKTIYRRGLGFRYGRKMQTLSGIHYNFSFSKKFWTTLQKKFGGEEEFTHFRSNGYLALCRNFLRWGWLNTYLFGATPALDRSYFDEMPTTLDLLDEHTVFAEKATAIRMSEFGYYSRLQSQLPISFNNLDEYTRDLEIAISTPSDKYAKIGTKKDGVPIQLNDHILQMEAEYYSRVRPKPPLDRMANGTIAGLRKSGVEYVEARAVDVNPYAEDGVDLDQLYFLHTFFVYCLLKKSPPIEKGEWQRITRNQNQVALRGRDASLKLLENGEELSVRDWGKRILEEMKEVTLLLDQWVDKGKYGQSLQRQIAKADDPDLTPSAQVLRALKREKKSFRIFSLEGAQKLKEALLRQQINSEFSQQCEEEAEKSFEAERLQVHMDDWILEGYESLETSTQMIIREALNRDVEVEVLDWTSNFIRLTKGNTVELVKQGTETSKESIITYFLMENKAVSKVILEEAGIRVPQGGVFTSLEEGVAAYPKVEKERVVVKPNHTNYGIGISFVDPHKPALYENALKEAFRHGKQVLVEEFCPGQEYRFLIISGQCIAICKRIPANVEGDGKLTVEELVRQKNRDPYCYKVPEYRIRLGQEEKRLLALQGHRPDSVLKAGEQVFLRDNSNVSTGGDPIDVTDEFDPPYCDIAIKAAEVCDSIFCGVDMVVQDKDAPPTPDNHAIIEVNFNPALLLHRYPVKGEKKYVERAVLDALGFVKSG